jgi:hypothetical protein
MRFGLTFLSTSVACEIMKCLGSLSPSSHTTPRSDVSSLAERCVDASCQIYSCGCLARSLAFMKYFIEAAGSACRAVALVIVTRLAFSPSPLPLPYLPVTAICFFYYPHRNLLVSCTASRLPRAQSRLLRFS